MKKASNWNKPEINREEVFSFAEGYKSFLSLCKTERECVSGIVELAHQNGYRNLKDVLKNKETLKAGDKVYAEHMGKTMALFIVGSADPEQGMNLTGAHIDSPRLDLKPNPLYEDTDLAMFETHYYGGIKKYQWVTLPMALHGVICKKDGTSVTVTIGEDPQDPVIGISDLLIHLADKQTQKTGKLVVEGEDLNAMVGCIPVDSEDEEEPVKRAVLDLLKKKYGIEEEDFISAELTIVPAGPARDYGLDRGMVMAYGQDDKVCAYPAVRAMMEIEHPERTCVCLLTDKEEIGSVGATGSESRFFENTVADLLFAMGCYSELRLRHMLQNSAMLSADVTAAFDPNYPDACERKNCGYQSKGIEFNKYTGSRGKSGSNDANAEFIARLRNIFDKASVFYNFGELGKVDQGGGGTIAYIMANYGMEVIDCGVPVFNMHAPWEITSKMDIYETYRAYTEFYKNY